jgi:isoleucyl-tRNA synthetase
VDFAEIAITSQCELIYAVGPADAFTSVDKSGIFVVVNKAEGQKCERCWKVLPEVGSDPEFPTLSRRDVDAVRWYIGQARHVA